MTERDLAKYWTLLKSVLTHWTHEDVAVLLNEVERLRTELAVMKAESDPRPVALRDHWAVRSRTDGAK